MVAWDQGRCKRFEPHLVRKNTTISVTMAIPNAFSLSLQVHDKPHSFRPLTDAGCMACPEDIQVPAQHQCAARGSTDQGGQEGT